MNGVLIIAHAPLASALRRCVLHVFADHSPRVVAFDVEPNMALEETRAGAAGALAQLGTATTLVLTDMLGATPCNVAQELANDLDTKLVAGVNLPMLLRTLTYLHEPLDALVVRSLAGGTQGVVAVAATSPRR